MGAKSALLFMKPLSKNGSTYGLWERMWILPREAGYSRYWKLEYGLVNAHPELVKAGTYTVMYLPGGSKVWSAYAPPTMEPNMTGLSGLSLK